MFMVVRNNLLAKLMMFRVSKLDGITIQVRNLLDSFFYDIYVLLYIVVGYIIITKVQTIHILMIISSLIILDLIVRILIDLNILLIRSSMFKNRIRNRLYYDLKSQNSTMDMIISNILILLIIMVSFIIIVVMIGLCLYDLQQLIITTTGYIYSNNEYLLYSQNSLSSSTINRLRSMLAGLLQNLSQYK